MGLVLFYGCVLIAYGPLLAMFLILFRNRSSLMILMMGSSFFWLLSALVAGVLWTLLKNVVPLFIFLLMAVGLQEAFRFVFWKLSTFAEPGLFSRTSPARAPVHRLHVASAVGLGVAAAHSLIVYGTALWDAAGPGTLLAPSCAGVSIFLVSAMYSLSFAVFNVASSIVAYAAYPKGREGATQLAVIAVIHLAMCYLSMSNISSARWSCFLSIPAVMATAASSAALAWLVCKDSLPHVRSAARGSSSAASGAYAPLTTESGDSS
jgi:anterior pharynx defective protein 1